MLGIGLSLWDGSVGAGVLHQFIDDNGVTSFIDDNGVTSFIDDNGLVI